MLENTEYNHSRRRRSGIVRTNLSVDAKRRVYLTRRSRRGCGASGIVRGDWETGSDLESGDEESGVESIDLTDISRSFQSSRNLEVLCDDRNEGERMELDQSVDVDLPEREDTQTDSGEVSLSDFANLLEESQSIPLETSSSDADTEDISPCESVELTQEPDSTHVEQALNDTIELDKPHRDFLPGKKNLVEEELLEYIPMNLKIPAHARPKSNRRSLESIEPILDRKAKLPLGPADAPLNK